jgi:purine-binding chemotaxis protein CheW
VNASNPSAAYLILGLQGALYAVEAAAVREILWLPELTPLEEAPVYIAGVANLRGRIVPVIDLHLRFGHAPPRYRLEDSVVVLGRETVQIGILVNDVRNVWEIGPEHLEAAPSYGRGAETRTRFLAGVAKVRDEIVMVLNLDHLVHLPDALDELGREEGSAPLAADREFCPEATPEERETFRERARSLSRPLESYEAHGRVPLAVVQLNGEYFGVDLAVVREFAAVPAVTPVPCCPPHIVGQMNLRGDILTLVDIRTILQMPVSDLSGGKVVVVHLGELRVAVPVEEVLDVLYLPPGDVREVPAAVQAASADYFKGMAPYGNKMLGILDLPRILTDERLVVSEEP